MLGASARSGSSRDSPWSCPRTDRRGPSLFFFRPRPCPSASREAARCSQFPLLLGLLEPGHPLRIDCCASCGLSVLMSVSPRYRKTYSRHLRTSSKISCVAPYERSRMADPDIFFKRGRALFRGLACRRGVTVSMVLGWLHRNPALIRLRARPGPWRRSTRRRLPSFPLEEETWTEAISESAPLIRCWVSLTSRPPVCRTSSGRRPTSCSQGDIVGTVLESPRRRAPRHCRRPRGTPETGGAVAIGALAGAGVSRPGFGRRGPRFLAAPPPSGPDFGRGRSTCTEEMSVWKSNPAVGAELVRRRAEPRALLYLDDITPAFVLDPLHTLVLHQKDRRSGRNVDEDVLRLEGKLYDRCRAHRSPEVSRPSAPPHSLRSGHVRPARNFQCDRRGRRRSERGADEDHQGERGWGRRRATIHGSCTPNVGRIMIAGAAPFISHPAPLMILVCARSLRLRPRRPTGSFAQTKHARIE